MRSFLSALAVLLLVAAPAAGYLEIDVLEGYLAEHDRVPGLPHCARHDGHVLVPGQGPVSTPAGATNDILLEHKLWHMEHNADSLQPSTDPADRYGDRFVYWHRDFVGAYEAWRADHGHPPLPAWDPGTPQPPELAYDVPGRGCVPGRDSDPQVALPTWATVEGGVDKDPVFGYTQMCMFEDTNQFGKAIGSRYHASVHQAMKGDMSVQQGPRDPAFWAFHRFLDDVVLGFEAECSAPSGEIPEPEARAAPASWPGALAALLLMVGWIRRGQGRPSLPSPG